MEMIRKSSRKAAMEKAIGDGADVIVSVEDDA